MTSWAIPNTEGKDSKDQIVARSCLKFNLNVVIPPVTWHKSIEPYEVLSPLQNGQTWLQHLPNWTGSRGFSQNLDSTKLYQGSTRPYEVPCCSTKGKGNLVKTIICWFSCRTTWKHSSLMIEIIWTITWRLSSQRDSPNACILLCHLEFTRRRWRPTISYSSAWEPIGDNQWIVECC